MREDAAPAALGVTLRPSADLGQDVPVGGEPPLLDEEGVGPKVILRLAGQQPVPLPDAAGITASGLSGCQPVEARPPPVPDERQGPVVVAIGPVAAEALAEGGTEDIPQLGGVGRLSEDELLAVRVQEDVTGGLVRPRPAGVRVRPVEGAGDVEGVPLGERRLEKILT